MKKNNIMQLETRRKIFNCIQNNPGLHFSELHRKIKIPKTTLFYHLNYLKKNELIIEEDKENYSRYYIAKKISQKEKRFLSYMRKKPSFCIVLLFFLKVCLSCSEISRELEMHPHTVDYHLKKLVKMDVIEPVKLNEDGNIVFKYEKIRVMKRKPVTNETIYNLKSAIWIYTTLVKFKKSLFDNNFVGNIEGFKNLMQDTWPLPNKINHYNSAIDSIEETLYEFIPIPFCA